MSYDIMVDLETMGTDTGSAFVSLGAVAFDLQKPYSPPGPGLTFYRNIDLQSSLDIGRTINGDTVYWWMSRSQEARESLMTPKPLPLKLVLQQFCEWYLAHHTRYQTCIWSHGLTFDVPMIADAMRQVGMKTPWFFSNANDTRTILRKAGIKMPSADERAGGHNALSDAVLQVEYLLKAMAIIDGKVASTVPEEPEAIVRVEF